MGRFAVWLSLSALLLGLPRSTFAASPPPLYFEEVLWAGSDRSTSDEWFELASTGEETRSLTGWRVTVLTATGEQLLASLDGLSIAPHGSLLIASHDQHHRFSAGESALAIDPDLVVPSLTLSNTRLKLRLYAPESSTPIDEAGTGGAPPAGSSKPPRSMERIDPAVSGVLSTSWRSATTRANLDPGTALVATPAHAGAASVRSTGSLTLTLDQATPVSLLLTDPDGEDDLVHVALTCGSETVLMNDQGIRHDGRAGDRWYSGLISSPDPSLTRCQVEVRDRSGLLTSLSVPVTLHVLAAPIRVSEVLSDPGPSGDEFVELENRGPTTVALTDWQLDDVPGGGSKPFTLSGFTVGPFSFLVLAKATTKLSLNNTGDQVVLIDPAGTVVDTVTVPVARTGESWSREPSGWAWVSPTPGSANAASPAPPLIASSDPPPSRTVAEFKRDPTGSQATLQGRVVARAGLLASSYGLIADGTGLVQVFWAGHQPVLPSLGSVVRVTGRRSSTSYPRLLLSDQSDVQAASDGVSLSPTLLTVALEQGLTDQSFVVGSVTVIRVNSNSLTVRAEPTNRLISLRWSLDRAEQPDRSLVVSGATLSVSGILADATDREPTLTLRTASDLTLIAPPPPTVASEPPPLTETADLVSQPLSAGSDRREFEILPARPTVVVSLVARPVIAAISIDRSGLVLDRLEARLARFKQLAAALLVAERSVTLERTLSQSQSETKSGMVGLASLVVGLGVFGEVRRAHRLLIRRTSTIEPGG